MKFRILFLISLFALAACTAETVEESAATAVPTTIPPTATTAEIAKATAVPTTVPTAPPPPTDEPAPSEPTALPPTEPPPTAEPEAEPVVVEYGRTAEGAFFHGASDAPVTLIDYSDFL
ncbi:MAG: hypothetical protein GY803_26555 [Chloroflexi bacterium]|nr:hypothetical protein [Chloroflexota bacterium]